MSPARGHYEQLLKSLRAGKTLEVTFEVSALRRCLDAELSGEVPQASTLPLGDLLAALEVFMSGENVSI